MSDTLEKLICDFLRHTNGRGATYGRLVEITGVLCALPSVLLGLKQDGKINFEPVNGRVTDEMMITLVETDPSIHVRILLKGETYEKKMPLGEPVLTKLIPAVRNGRDPVEVLLYLAAIGSQHVTDKKHKISRANKMGL